MPDSPRWLVTINGRVPRHQDLATLGQAALAVMLFDHAVVYVTADMRAEFAQESHAVAFRDKASREFPEDDVRLWASVDTPTTAR